MILDRSPGACYETMGMFRHVQEEPDLPYSVLVIVRQTKKGRGVRAERDRVHVGFYEFHVPCGDSVMIPMQFLVTSRIISAYFESW